MRRFALVSFAVALALTAGCTSQWQAEPTAVLDGFQAPESVRLDGQTLYVSNVVGAEDAPEGANPYWMDDGTGFISKLAAGPEPTIQQLRWVESSENFTLNGPKGMMVHNGVLWVADNTKLVAIDLEAGTARRISIEGAKKLNDVATDGSAIYVADSGKARIYRIGDLGQGQVQLIKAPEAINGITFAGGKMYGVSWELHEIYTLDPTGAGEPEPMGLAENFTNLDGIEVLGDGSIIVSDFHGNTVWIVAPDHKTVRPLVDIQTPADICVDRQNMLLYVPQMLHDKVAVFRLSKK
jgi:DNA-binding beta-propeller fold protein YncE